MKNVTFIILLINIIFSFILNSHKKQIEELEKRLDKIENKKDF